jgi:hypothetical protein
MRMTVQTEQLLKMAAPMNACTPIEQRAVVRFRQQPQEFYAAGFQGLVKRWDKCLNVYGDYVEK